MKGGRVFTLCFLSLVIGGVLGGILGALGGWLTGGFVGAASGACTAAKVAVDQGVLTELEANQVLGQTAENFLSQGRMDQRVSEALKGGVQGCLKEANATR